MDIDLNFGREQHGREYASHSTSRLTLRLSEDLEFRSIGVDVMSGRYFDGVAVGQRMYSN
jgi:hypothetical protein